MRWVLPWIGSCLLVVVALAWPTRSAHAQNTVHDDCDYCHNVHGGGGFIPLTDHNRDVDLCLSCHDDGAPPTYNGETVPKGVAIHAGTDHAVADTTSCVDCHDHEGEAGGNLALIPRQLNSRYTGLKTVVFTARTGTNSFADGNTTYDGVCEVCHTQTSYHLSTGGGASHNAGQDCVTCHAHDAGFQGAGGCTICHSTPQDNGDGVPVGGRRAVVGEFARRSHHVLVTPVDSIPDGDCTTCHDMVQHQQGSVRLKNADNAGIVYALTGDPATSGSEAAKLTDFCLSCHDANAAGGAVPFSDGLTPPVIDNAFWVASSHEQSAAIVGCYGNGQFGCHATGHGSAKQNLLAPAGTAPTAPASAEEEEGFCLSCHRSGGVATTDLKTAFDQPINWVQLATGLSSNPNLNDRHDVQYAAQARSGAMIECTSCHDPHRASTVQKYILDPDANDGHVVGTNWYFAAYQAANDRLSEFCLDCHDGTFAPGVIGHPAPYPITNIRTTWVNDGMGARSASSANLRSGTGWAVGDVLPCWACHATHLQLDRHVTPPSIGTPSLFRMVDMVWNKTGSDSLFFQDSKATDPLIYNYAITDNQDKNDLTSGGYWCNTCHNRYSMTGKENCYGCHRHGDGGRW